MSVYRRKLFKEKILGKPTVLNMDEDALLIYNEFLATFLFS